MQVQKHHHTTATARSATRASGPSVTRASGPSVSCVWRPSICPNWIDALHAAVGSKQCVRAYCFEPYQASSHCTAHDPTCWVVQALQQGHECGFAAAAEPHQCCQLAGLQPQVHTRQGRAVGPAGARHTDTRSEHRVSPCPTPPPPPPYRRSLGRAHCLLLDPCLHALSADIADRHFNGWIPGQACTLNELEHPECGT